MYPLPGIFVVLFWYSKSSMSQVDQFLEIAILSQHNHFYYRLIDINKN